MEIKRIENKVKNIKKNLGENDNFIKILNENVSKIEIEIIKLQEEINYLKFYIYFINKNSELFIKLMKKDFEYSENIEKILQIKKIIELQKVYLFNKIYKEALKYLII